VLEAVFLLRRRAYWSAGPSQVEPVKALTDDDDSSGLILVARTGDEIVGTLRMNFVDVGVSTELAAGLALDRFLEHANPARVVVNSRLAVAPEHRGGALAGLMMLAAAQRAAARQFEVALCDCQPHLLDLYHSTRPVVISAKA
jgi:predicted N-acetyltransferase YhbS